MKRASGSGSAANSQAHGPSPSIAIQSFYEWGSQEKYFPGGFRVPIIDSMIFPLFLNKQMEKAENFQPIQPGVYRLSDDGQKIVAAVYNRLLINWDSRKG